MSINYLDKTGLEHIGDIANYKKRNIDYTTYTGTDLEIEDTLENKINFNNLYGQTEQDSYEGKNLFDKSAVTLGKIVSRTDGTLSNAANYNASDYIPMKENTTYTLTALNFNRWYSACYDENKNYIGYVDNEATFTTISGTKYMRFTIYNNAMDTAMIVEGTELPDYEPYVGGTTSPNPDYPQEIKTVTGRQVVKITGKNLCNGISQGYYLTSTATNAGVTTSDSGLIIPVYSNTNYTISTTQNQTRYRIAFSDEEYSGTSINCHNGSNRDNTSDTISVNSTTHKFLIVNATDLTKIQIEQGSTATDYEEYKEQSYELNLGKNLFDIDGDFTYGGYSDVPIINDDGTLTSNANYLSARSAGKLISLLKPNTNYILSAELISTTSTDSNKAVVEILQGTRGSLTILGRTYFTQTDSKTISFTTPNDTSKIWISISSIGANTSSTFGKIQLEKGEEATSYSPYFTPIELCKIGDYQDSIKKSTGKNLFSSEIELGNITGTGTKEDSTTRCRTKDFISIKPNTTYSLWNNKSQTYNLYFYDENKNYLSYLYVSGNSFTTPANSKYIMFLFGNVVLDILVMLNEGPTALPYEPYGVGKWYVEKKVGKLIFDGSDDEQWGLASNSRFYCDANLYNGGVLPSTNADDFNAYSNLLKSDNYNSSWNNLTNNTISVASNNTSNPRIINANYTDITSFKTWLSNNNVILYYPLSTPTGEEITDEELIEQLNDLYDAFYMNSKTYINVEGDLPIVLEINHDKPRFLNLIDKGELQKYIIDLEKRVAILESQITE